MPVDIARMTKVFGRPESLTQARSTYCPGCHHGIITRIIGQGKLVDVWLGGLSGST